jgi:hypothetical protein
MITGHEISEESLPKKQTAQIQKEDKMISDETEIMWRREKN